ncbi:hypothetical protein ACFLTK_01035 [Chloroflexota bacterium]
MLIKFTLWSLFIYLTTLVSLVQASAIPEFSTIIAAVVVAGLYFGIYCWMRKREMAYVKAWNSLYRLAGDTGSVDGIYRG